MVTKININFLPLVSFYKSKDYTNKVRVKDNYWDNLWKNLNKTFLHLLPELEKNCELETIGLKCHKCSNDSINTLFNVIKSCHFDLWSWVIQKNENIANITYFQIHIGNASSKEVLYSLLFEETENSKILYPLILDLNHCIYKVSKEKGYRYRYDKKSKEWDFSSKKNDIHKIILDGLSKFL